MIRVAVIGSTGQLGTDLVKVLNESGKYQVFPIGHERIECSHLTSVQKALEEVRPEVVVNCAAFVRVDECEDKPEEAFRVNALGALCVARCCADLGALCVYISTDYVFDGDKELPYTENDIPRPINVYGNSKLAGEYFVQQVCPRWLIVRMASLFGKAGARGKGGNFVETILSKARAGDQLKVVNDIRMSPTYTLDAARAIEQLLQQRASGLFHLTNQGHCSWYEFARQALELAGIHYNMQPVASVDYPTKAHRPRNSSLTSVKLDSSARELLRPWEEALRAYMIEKGYL